MLLTLSLRRLDSRQPRWHLAFVLLAAALPCTAAGIAAAVSPTYGPGSGVLTGIVARCPPAKLRASGLDPDPSPVVTMSVWNQDGQIIASQSLPLRMSGARYHMRLAAGTYSIDASTALEGVQAGVRLYIPADKTIEEDFKDYSSSMCAGWLLIVWRIWLLCVFGVWFLLCRRFGCGVAGWRGCGSRRRGGPRVWRCD